MDEKEIKPLPESPTVEKTLREEVHEIHGKVFPDNEKGKKPKELKINRLKPSKSKAKKNWVGVMSINENKTVSIEKQQVIGSTIQTKDKFYHAINDDNILYYKGRPFIIQPSIQLNPWNAKQKVYWEDKDKNIVEAPLNQVHGQHYVADRLETDKVEGKKKGFGSGILIIAAVGVGIYLIGHFLLKIF